VPGKTLIAKTTVPGRLPGTEPNRPAQHPREIPTLTAQSYNVIAELDTEFGPENAERLLGPLADYSGAARRSELGHAEVVFTVPAKSVRQANSTALAILETYPWPLHWVRVLLTDDYDYLLNGVDLPRCCQFRRPPTRSESAARP